MADLTPKTNMAVKVYLVLCPDHLAKDGEPNVRVVGAKLTRAAAESIVDKLPGASIQRMVADKV